MNFNQDNNQQQSLSKDTLSQHLHPVLLFHTQMLKHHYISLHLFNILSNVISLFLWCSCIHHSGVPLKDAELLIWQNSHYFASTSCPFVSLILAAGFPLNPALYPRHMFSPSTVSKERFCRESEPFYAEPGQKGCRETKSQNILIYLKWYRIIQTVVRIM